LSQAAQESFPELTVLQKTGSQKQTIRFDISRMSAPEKNYFTIWAPASQVKTVDYIYKQEILKNLQAADIYLFYLFIFGQKHITQGKIVSHTPAPLFLRKKGLTLVVRGFQ